MIMVALDHDFFRTKAEVEAWPDNLSDLNATAEFARIVAAAGSAP